MKFNTQLKALAAATAIGLSGHAMAEGTTGGTTIENEVTLGYTVNDVAQTGLKQSVNFIVDTKVDFTLIMNETTSVKLSPGANNGGNGYDAQYTLTNTSNETLGFTLTLNDLTNGSDYTVDEFTPTTVSDTVDLGGSISVYV